MIITKIQMANFRVFQEKTINFHNKEAILLSAANGVGKTTTIDAIEWCLTGDIRRLRVPYDQRSTNNVERKINTEGILKHRDVDAKGKVKVVLWMQEEEREIIVCREQTKDKLDSKQSKATVKVNGTPINAETFIHKYVGDSFYNYHFCDIQKSFDIQSRSRRDLKDFFKDFITNYDKQKQVVNSLELFVEDIERYKLDKERLMVSEQNLENDRKELHEKSKNMQQIAYPNVRFFSDEILEVKELNKEELIDQKRRIENCAYQKVRDELIELVENETKKTQYLTLTKIAAYWETERTNIQYAEKVGLLTSSEVIDMAEEKVSKLQRISLTTDTIFREEEILVELGNKDLSQDVFTVYKSKINEKKEIIKQLSDEIYLLSKNNEIFRVLSALVSHKQEIIKYRNDSLKEKGKVFCPICGSNIFATEDENNILEEATKYVKKNGEIAALKEKEKGILESEIEELYKQLTDRAKEVVEQEKQKLTDEISKLNTVRHHIDPYLNEVKKLQKMRKDIKVEGLTNEKINNLLGSTKHSLLEEIREKDIIKEYQQILTVLGYDYENETMQQTYAKIQKLISEQCSILYFSYDEFVTKINAIEALLTNRDYFELKKKIERNENTNNKLSAEIEGLCKLSEIASQKIEDINGLIDELSKEEYEAVGPTLCKFFNKLSRFNACNGIKLIQENEGISLVDDKGKNIVNVLSNGQISVFLLSYFFAAINARSADEKMKIYFIDDLTACMDDVNMLAFMDLLKYQMSSKSTMDQLFFVTCDERISKLFKYKMNGRGIEICELLEQDFM